MIYSCLSLKESLHEGWKFEVVEDSTDRVKATPYIQFVPGMAYVWCSPKQIEAWKLKLVARVQADLADKIAKLQMQLNKLDKIGERGGVKTVDPAAVG